MRALGQHGHHVNDTKGRTYEPLLGATDVARGDTRDTVAREVVGVHRCEEHVARVDRERLAAEGQRNLGRRRAGDREAALAVGLRAGDGRVHGRGVGSGSDDESGAGVEDGGAALETEVLAADGDGHVALPEALRVDVVEGDERRGVELGVVETAKGDLAVVLRVVETRDLVRGNGIRDEAVLRQSLDGCQGLLLGERLGNGSATKQNPVN